MLKLYGLSDGGFGIWVRCWCGYLVRKRSNYQNGPLHRGKLPFRSSIITLMKPITYPIPPKMRNIPTIVPMIGIKKSGIILFWFELCSKVNKKNWYAKRFFTEKGEKFLKNLWIKKMLLILQWRLVHVLQLRVVWTRGHKYQFSFFIMWYIISALFLKASESEWDAGAGIWFGDEVITRRKDHAHEGNYLLEVR